MQDTIASLIRFAFVAALVLPPGSAAAEGPPSAPTGLSASVQSPHEIRLSWDSSSGASSYVVYRDSDGNGYSFRELETTYGTSFTDRDVTGGRTYVYVVKAKRDSALSTASGQAKATLPPDAPSELSASVGSERSVKLSWSGVSQVASYMVLRSTDSGGYGLHELGTTYGTSYTDNDVKAGTAYYYVVKAKTQGGAMSAGSNQASAVLPLAAPQNLSASASSSSEIRLSWDSVFGANSYVIRRSTDSSDYSFREVGSAYGASYTDTNLAGGTTYYYVVEAKSSTSKSAPSRQAHAKTQAKRDSGD
jgi:fibronectin type 3 domain-containing protein